MQKNPIMAVAAMTAGAMASTASYEPITLRRRSSTYDHLYVGSPRTTKRHKSRLWAKARGARLTRGGQK